MQTSAGSLPPCTPPSSALSSRTQHRLQPLPRLLLLVTLLAAAAAVSLSPSFPSSSSSPSASSSFLLGADATFVEGSLYKDDPWSYLEKFCFDEKGGRVEFTFYEDARVSANYPGRSQWISFYADQEEQWFTVYGSSLSCQEKVNRAKLSYELKNLDDPRYNFHFGYDVAGIVPRWWYITVSNCGYFATGDPSYNISAGEHPEPLAITYWSIHFTNKTGKFSYEFSKDVQGILEMSIFFLLLYIGLMFLLAWIKGHAKQKNLQYTVVKFVFASMLIESIALLFNMAHYARFATDGIGVPGLENSHFFFDFISNLVLLYTVINICKGWAISTNYIPDRRVSYIVIAALFLLYVALFIWVQKIMDPASVLYIYETPPGWTVVAVRAALALYAIVCVIRTYQMEKETNRKQFYLVWLFFAVCWLISLPVIVGIAHNVESWKRRRVVFGLVNSVQAVMYIVLTYLFRPFRSNRYVDILKPDESRAFGSNNMQIFPSAGPIEFATI